MEKLGRILKINSFNCPSETRFNQPTDKTLNTFEITEDVDYIKSKPNGLVYFSNSQMINISSSDIRGKIAANQNLDNLLPKSIISFLEKI